MTRKLSYEAAPKWAGSPPAHTVRSYYILGCDEVLDMRLRALTKQERDMVDDPESEMGRMLRAYTADLVIPGGSNN